MRCALPRRADGFAAHGLVEAGLDLQLDRVGELGARCREELDPVVFKRVVGRRNHDAHLQAQGAGQVGNGRRRQRAGQVDVDTRRRKARLPGHDSSM
jgi:hypothetical protein